MRTGELAEDVRRLRALHEGAQPMSLRTRLRPPGRDYGARGAPGWGRAIRAAKCRSTSSRSSRRWWIRGEDVARRTDEGWPRVP
jgi:hypothetical protein